MVQNVFVLESYLRNNRGVRSNYKFWAHRIRWHLSFAAAIGCIFSWIFAPVKCTGRGGGKQEPGRVVSRGWVINGALVLRARNGRDHWRIARSSCGHDFVTRARSPTYLNTLIIVYKNDWLFYDLVFFFF